MGPDRDGDAERELLVAAQAGDEHAFRRLVELHRADLQAHCYRMLASWADAEDAYQDTLLRAWRALDRFDGRSRLSTWLYRIATNVCLSALRRTSRQRVLPAGVGDGEQELDWVGPYPDEAFGVPSGFADPSAQFDRRESVELAFVAALQLLPPRQRAALVLSQVLGLRAAEVADVLGTSVAAVTSALQRARARLDELRPVESQQAVLRGLGDAHVTGLVRLFAAALEDGDAPMLTRLLTEDVVFEMPPYPQTARGRADVAGSWLVPTRRPTGLRTRVTSCNAQPAVAVYSSADPEAPARFVALDVLALDRRGLTRITAFRDPAAATALGLPEALPPL